MMHSPAPDAAATGPRPILVPLSPAQPLPHLQWGGGTCLRWEASNSKGRSCRCTRHQNKSDATRWRAASPSKPVNVVHRYVSGWKGQTLPSHPSSCASSSHVLLSATSLQSLFNFRLFISKAALSKPFQASKPTI